MEQRDHIVAEAACACFLESESVILSDGLIIETNSLTCCENDYGGLSDEYNDDW